MIVLGNETAHEIAAEAPRGAARLASAVDQPEPDLDDTDVDETALHPSIDRSGLDQPGLDPIRLDPHERLQPLHATVLIIGASLLLWGIILAPIIWLLWR